MPMIETSASARPSFRRPIPFTVVTIVKGVCAAPDSPDPAPTFWPVALFNPASAAVAAACFRKLRLSISILLLCVFDVSPLEKDTSSGDSLFPCYLHQGIIGSLKPDVNLSQKCEGWNDALCSCASHLCSVLFYFHRENVYSNGRK